MIQKNLDKMLDLGFLKISLGERVVFLAPTEGSNTADPYPNPAGQK